MNTHTERKRIFFAVDLDHQMNEKIIEFEGQLRHRLKHARILWSPLENLHVTLKFLGSVEVDRIDSLVQAVGHATHGFEPFQVIAQGLGGFPNEDRARIIWVGIEDPESSLLTLATLLDEKLTQFGFGPEERVYRPHLTIGRVKERSVRLREANQLVPTVEFGSTRIEAIHLYESMTRPAGAIYQKLTTLSLIPGASKY
jgi:2'-5' RNA ligase